ncbi:MAG: GAF domain-containing protein [Fimbriimonadaceae bacterium]|nr:GAF domain-containing protein [Fimbriimonadaceae bacterium]QYK56011.1 MAG: GAF domain-containing protein [Fimbriimonadaceae bacterium]
MRPQFEAVLYAVRESPAKGRALRELAIRQLDGLDGYDWSGVYRMDGGRLVLDAYCGADTEHTEIEVGVGVCGTAVAEDQDQVVEDVRALTNYLSCSTHTRSEIVVLIRDGDGAVLGQIDIDGHTVGQFGEEDRAFLQVLGSLLAERWQE